MESMGLSRLDKVREGGFHYHGNNVTLWVRLSLVKLG